MKGLVSMTKRKLFVCLTALLLISVFAISVSARADNDKSTEVLGFGIFRATSNQMLSNPNLVLTVSSVTHNNSNAYFQVSAFIKYDSLADFSEEGYHTSDRGISRYELKFPLYFTIDLYPTKIKTNHFLMDSEEYAYEGLYDVISAVSIP